MPVIALSAILNNTPVVATMIPAINTWAKRIHIPPSRLMIPLSYTAILGGTLTLIGTSTNLVVNGQHQALTGERVLSMFSMTAVGLPVALAGAVLMIATGCCSVSQAEKGLDLMVIATIAASFAMGMALEKTGVAGLLAQAIIELGAGKPWLLLILCYVLVSLLTELITNNAAAVLVLPIVLELTEKASLDVEPVLFAVMMAASASFATPLGYQTNLMVYGPGAYRFGDFLRVGLPMNACVGAVTLIVLLVGWPLQEVSGLRVLDVLP